MKGPVCCLCLDASLFLLSMLSNIRTRGQREGIFIIWISHQEAPVIRTFFCIQCSLTYKRLSGSKNHAKAPFFLFLFKQYSNKKFAPRVTKTHRGGLLRVYIHFIIGVKARLHRRFLSQQLDAILVALELQLQNRTCKPGAICGRDIARGFQHV